MKDSFSSVICEPCALDYGHYESENSIALYKSRNNDNVCINSDSVANLRMRIPCAFSISCCESICKWFLRQAVLS